MGFHLVDKVYANVTGTTPKAQAVLAYLAHRADDSGIRKCYPKRETIAAATHFDIKSVARALNELREDNLLTWISGGRNKGCGGRALANEYTFNLPDKPASGRGTQSPHAEGHSDPKQRVTESPCIGTQSPPINQDQSEYHSSVTNTDADGDKVKKMLVSLADHFSAQKAMARANAEGKREVRRGVVDEAMIAAGVDDFENRKTFSLVMMRRDSQQCLDVIFGFASQRKAGELDGLRKPAAELTRRLETLPIVR